MTIQYKFFSINVVDHGSQEDELNRFLKQVKVINVEKEFVDSGCQSFWAVAVQYLLEGSESKIPAGKKQRIDYKEVLSPEEFSKYALLRDWRKDAASKEAVPVYTVFTNEQLAAIVRNKVKSTAELAKIEGIGEARIKKWSSSVLEILVGNCEPDKL